MLNSKTLFAIALLVASAACDDGEAVASKSEYQQSTQMTVPQRVPTFTYEVVKAYPHDTSAFTQGLVFHQGVLYESTGINGSSSLRRVDLDTGRVLNQRKLSDEYFAEGLALLNGRLYQLTWQSQRGFIYDLDSFNHLSDFNYSGEGWGLTHDTRSLILSDGTSKIRFLNPDTFEVQRVITVKDNGRDITQLNELEYIKGEIWANIWLTDRIARIDPQSGRVGSWINLSGLLMTDESLGSGAVLNGIAYDEASDRLFVTGKLWPKLFEIKIKQQRNTMRR